MTYGLTTVDEGTWVEGIDLRMYQPAKSKCTYKKKSLVQTNPAPLDHSLSKPVAFGWAQFQLTSESLMGHVLLEHYLETCKIHSRTRYDASKGRSQNWEPVSNGHLPLVIRTFQGKPMDRNGFGRVLDVAASPCGSKRRLPVFVDVIAKGR